MLRFTIQSNFTAPTRPQVLAGRFSRRGGFSLIEVAIAMAIFVFGALAIVRIFPGALGVVQNSEQRAIGQRMAQTTLARLNAQPRSIPFALFDTNRLVFDATTNPTSWSDFPGAVYGTPNSDDNQSLAQAAPEAGDLTSPNSSLNQSAMGHFRRVFSETQRVGANGEILLNFPYVGADPAAFNAALNPVIKIRRDVEGVTLNDDGTLNFRNARLQGSSALFRDDTLAIRNERPPDSHPTYVTPEDPITLRRSSVTFYISYNWRSGGQVSGVQDEPKKFNDNVNWVALSPQVAQTAAGATVLAGPVKVWFYQSYRIPAAQQGDLAYDPNLGRMVQLTGLTVGFPLPATTIQAGQLVSIDYTVPDWRFIVTDNNLTTQISDADRAYLTDDAQVTLTGANVNQLVLPTRYVSDEALSNDATLTNRPSQLYTLLRGSAPTGVTATPARNDWSPDKTPTLPNISGDTTAYRAIAVRPKTGQVFFDVNSLVSPSARVVYRNIEGWVQQPAIAANFYAPYIDGADRSLFPREPWREYFYVPNNAENRIFFHASEAGKSVTASYIYLDGGNYITMNDVPVPIEADVADRPGVVPTDFNGKYLLNGTVADCTKISFAYLRDNQGRSIGADTGNGGNATARIIAISEIRGASIRVRSGWFDGSRYTQTAVVGYRPLDVESYNRS